jgi:hypothetical protein
MRYKKALQWEIDMVFDHMTLHPDIARFGLDVRKKYQEDLNLVDMEAEQILAEIEQAVHQDDEDSSS